jgi:L-ascorbate metabolism protein UlaG (beta-lactamase superfamily)
MDASLTFVGTATTILRLGSITLLTDPNFLHRGEAAYLGYGMWSRRRTQPALDLDELPGLDAVVLSHLHGDHFDRIAKVGLPRDLPIVTTEPAADRLAGRWRFRAAIGLPTWSYFEFHRGDETVRISAVPGRHGPGPVDWLLPTVMGSVVDWSVGGERRLRLYITGDTLYRPGLRAIPERYPDIDTMLVHLGGTRILGLLLTMDGRQGADLVELVRPGLTIPIHYDDYPVFRSPRSHLDLADAAHDRGHRIQSIQRGETVALAGVRQPG